MEFLLIGIITAFNFLVLQYKFNHERWGDLTFDLIVLFILSYLFKGSFGGLIVAMTASFIVSLTLLKFPPKFPNIE